MHHYHTHQEKLDAHPVDAPRSEEFLEIRKIFFRWQPCIFFYRIICYV